MDCVSVPLDSFGVRRAAHFGGFPCDIMSLNGLAQRFPQVRTLPLGLRILLENLLRHEDGHNVHADHIAALADRRSRRSSSAEISFHPSRIIMQDYSGLVALVDLATLRDEVSQAGADPADVATALPVDLVIDHSLKVTHSRQPDAHLRNLAEEYAQNRERYEFLKWAQGAFSNLRVVPPGNGIVHQVNLEALARVVAHDATTDFVHPETQIGTDSHTTMINGLGVLAWGVGGIEAEAAMLGEPVTMLIPPVTGVRLHGALDRGLLATDIVLTLTERLRQAGVVGHFVEFFGPAVAELSVPDRATLANMAPEYGATCGLFPVDTNTLTYLAQTGRPQAEIALAADHTHYFSSAADEGAVDFDDIVEFDLSSVRPAVAGPRRPQELLSLSEVPGSIPAVPAVGGRAFHEGDVVLAAITSCTNTSNPRSMLAAGLLARNAIGAGLSVKPHIKTSLAPGSKAVTDYLMAAGLLEPLARLGFALVGFGCTTCVGNSGPLDSAVEEAIRRDDPSVAAVLSGNRNFEGRIHPLVRLNYLASPPLVIAYAMAGTVNIDLEREPLGRDRRGRPVYLHDLWPSADEIDSLIARHITPQLFRAEPADRFAGGADWEQLTATSGPRFPWCEMSGYIGPSPFVAAEALANPIVGARPLLVLGDNVTTDHISPVGSIPPDSPAGEFLQHRNTRPSDFNSYGARRGNAEVMARGTFANPRLVNELTTREGGWTIHLPSGEETTVYEAAMRYRRGGIPTVVVAGRNYGAGSARDWAAKGTRMLGVRAVIAESFERIHRANLVMMQVLPIEIEPPATRHDLQVGPHTALDFHLPDQLVRGRLLVEAREPGGVVRRVCATLRVDTTREAAYAEAGGILPFIRGRLVAASAAYAEKTAP